MGLRDHTQTHHSRYGSSGQVIGPTQRPLPDNTQHSQEIYIPGAGFELTIPANERPETHALDCMATGIGGATTAAILREGDDKSLARPGRKQTTATEDFDVHMSYL